MVDWTRDDEDTNAHMSDISLRLPASARAASDNSESVTLCQAEGNTMRNAPGLHPKLAQTGVNPWQLHYPSTYTKGSPAVHGLQETGQLVINKEKFSLLLIKMKRLRGKILSVLWQKKRSAEL